MNVTHEPSVWALLILIERMKVHVMSMTELSETFADALVAATDAVEMSEIVPVTLTVHELPKTLSVHVSGMAGSGRKSMLPVADLPSAAILPVNVDLGHLMVVPPLLRTALVPLTILPLMLPPAGVTVALAGAARAASTASAATATSKPRMGADFIR